MYVSDVETQQGVYTRTVVQAFAISGAYQKQGPLQQHSASLGLFKLLLSSFRTSNVSTKEYLQAARAIVRHRCQAVQLRAASRPKGDWTQSRMGISSFACWRCTAPWAGSPFIYSARVTTIARTQLRCNRCECV